MSIFSSCIEKITPSFEFKELVLFLVTENLENNIKIDGINDGETVKFTAHNINFNTFQFYFNVLNVTDDFALSSLFLPTNIVGNVTNISTNELALGNFGVSGYSTLTMDF